MGDWEFVFVYGLKGLLSCGLDVTCQIVFLAVYCDSAAV